jgi:putative transcriptional regulator
MKALALLAALLCAAPASALEPAIGRFLIANRQVNGFFTASVIVLVDHGEHGSLGLIVNRPIGMKLTELLPELPARDEPAFLGGPVARDQLLLLVRGDPPAVSAPVLDGVHVSGSRDTLRALLEAPPAKSEFRAYVGYAGWAAGQLESEIARGDWLVAPGDAASVFTRDPAGLWEQLFQKHRTIEVQAPTRRPHPPAAWLVASRGVQRRPHPPAAWLVASRGVQRLDAPRKSITLSAPWRSAAASSAFRTSASPRSSTR